MQKLIELSDIKNGLILGTVTEQEAADVIRRKDMQMNIHEIIDHFDDGEIAFDETTLAFIANVAEITWYIFDRTGLDTGIDDTEYDKLKDILVANGKEDFVTLPMRVSAKDKETTHLYPQLRGTLSKIHYLTQPEEKVNKSRKTLDSWIEKTERLYTSKTGKSIDLKDQWVYVFPKWDGVSIIFQFDEKGDMSKALTRGYTKFNTAEDVSHHFIGTHRELMRLDGGSEPPIPYGLKTEVMVHESYVLEYNKNYSKDYKQSRAVASGIINSDLPDERNEHLVIMQLRYLEEGSDIEELCPEVFDHPYIKTKLGNIEEIERFATDHRYADGLRCDGAVIYLIDRDLRLILGRDNDKNNFEVAYKFTEEYKYTYVKDIEFQVGLLGRITPVVKVEPVKLKGNKISSASLSNIDNMERLGLAKGDMVKILYDIIPYATVDVECEMNKSGHKPIRPITKCPSCGHPTVREGAMLTCINPECDCIQKGRILNYLIKLRILDISYASVDALYEMGVLRDITDLYKLENYRDFIISHKGFGDLTFDNWINQINNKRTVLDYIVLGALGIDGIAEKNFKLILSHYSFDEFMDIVNDGDIDLLTSIKGIGEKKAKRIIKGIKDYKDELKFLWKELDIISSYELEDSKFRVCFSKIRDSELERYIINMGGEVVDSITKETKVDFLVVPNKFVSSSKISKAINYGVDVVTPDELLAILKKYDTNK